MVVVVFRSRLRENIGPEFQPLAARMLEIAQTMPGFKGYKAFQAPDGERVSIIDFETLADAQGWREHPEHRKAQARGRNEFYSDYSLQVCEVQRDSFFPAEEG